jgi:hypothetical protein
MTGERHSKIEHAAVTSVLAARSLMSLAFTTAILLPTAH